MRVSREKAIENIKEFYATVKKLTKLTNGDVKNGMLKMVQDTMGTKLRLGLYDLVMASKMNEQDFIEYAGPKLYPSYFKAEEEKEKEKRNDAEKTETTDNTTIAITNIGKVLVNIYQKLDTIIELEKLQIEHMVRIDKKLNTLFAEEMQKG